MQRGLGELNDLRVEVLSGREHFVIEDLVDASSLVCARELHVLFSQPSYEAPDKAIFLPHISFSRFADRIERYAVEQRAEVARLHDEYGAPEYQRFAFGHVTLLVSPVPDEDSARACWVFAEIAHLFYRTSDIFQNLLGSYGHKAAKGFLKSAEEDRYDLTTLCKYVSEHFGCGAHFLVPSGTSFLPEQPASTAELDELLGDVDVRTSIERSMLRRQRYSGRLTGQRGPTYYVIIPLLDPRHEPKVQRGAIILYGRQRISLASSAAASDIAQDVIVRQYLIGQANLLAALHDRLFESQSTVRQSWGRAALNSALEAFARQCVQGTVKCSSAFSAVLRLYDPFRGELVPIAVCHGPHGEYANGTPEPISVDRWRHSVNAYCFRFCRGDEFVYLPHGGDSIPPEYAERGLERVLVRRTRTVSEICLPIRKRGLSIGVFNVEASGRQAFSGDIPFFQSVVKSFVDYYEIVRARNDSEWLSQLSFQHDREHRLEEFARSLSLEQQNKLRRLLRGTERPRAAPATEASGSNASNEDSLLLSDVVAEIINLASTLQASEEPKPVVRATGDLAVRVSPAFASSLRLIAQSLLENSKKHAHLRGDSLSLEVTGDLLDDAWAPAGHELRVRYDSAGIVALPTLDQMFHLPMSKQQNGELHLGLFLVGVHTRLLGGVVEPRIGHDGEEHQPLNVLIRLPLPPVDGGSA